MVSFAFCPIPTPHSTTRPCSSSSTSDSSRVTLYSLPFSSTSHPLSPLHPVISFSSPPSPSPAAVAAASFSHATCPAPSTFTIKVTSPAVNFLHSSDHDYEPEQGVDPFPLSVADPDSDYEPAIDLQSSSPPSPVHGQCPRGQPKGCTRAQGQSGDSSINQPDSSVVEHPACKGESWV